MGWSANRTSTGSFHVVNDEDGSHFEAETEDEIHEVLDELDRREQERKQAEEQQQPQEGLRVADNSVPVGRSN